jgi:MerR family transcriptional regulator/heat shock protein HspR
MKYSKKEPLFTISIAAQKMGLHPRTLMIYEKNGLIKPFRTRTNRRRYSQDDLEKIKFIQFLTQKKKVNLAGVKLILEFIKFGKKQKFDLKKSFFSDF